MKTKACCSAKRNGMAHHNYDCEARTPLHSPGEWKVREDKAGALWIETRHEVVALVDYQDLGTNKANAQIIAEAGTIANETGLTPRQMETQRADLLANLKWASQFIKRTHAPTPALREAMEDIDSAIARAQPDLLKALENIKEKLPYVGVAGTVKAIRATCGKAIASAKGGSK